MIGTAGGPDKVATALAAGYDHVIDYKKDNFVDEVMKITNNQKCDVVYDSVAVSYTHLRAHETCADLVCRLLLEKKK